jgi:hypothetical protein
LGRGARSATERVEDGFGDVVQVGQDVVIPEAQDSKAELLQEGRSLGIESFTVVIGVRIAVDFDDESGLKANEVDDVPSKWMLTPEFSAIHAMRAKTRP